MIADPVFLLECVIVFLVDDNRPQVAEWQEQGGTRADHDFGMSGRDGPPGTSANRAADFGMPDDRLCPEPVAKALQPLGSQGDFRQQNQDLAVQAQAFGNRFEIDLGLTGTGDAIQKIDAEFL